MCADLEAQLLERNSSVPQSADIDLQNDTLTETHLQTTADSTEKLHQKIAELEQDLLRCSEQFSEQELQYISEIQTLKERVQTMTRDSESGVPSRELYEQKIEMLQKELKRSQEVERALQEEIQQLNECLASSAADANRTTFLGDQSTVCIPFSMNTTAGNDEIAKAYELEIQTLLDKAKEAENARQSVHGENEKLVAKTQALEAERDMLTQELVALEQRYQSELDPLREKLLQAEVKWKNSGSRRRSVVIDSPSRALADRAENDLQKQLKGLTDKVRELETVRDRLREDQRRSLMQVDKEVGHIDYNYAHFK